MRFREIDIVLVDRYPFERYLIIWGDISTKIISIALATDTILKHPAEHIFFYSSVATNVFFTFTVARARKTRQNEESKNEKTSAKRCEKRQTSHSHRRSHR